MKTDTDMAQALRTARTFISRFSGPQSTKAMRQIDAALADQESRAQAASAADGYVLDVIRENRTRSLDLEWDIKNKWPTWDKDAQVLGFLTVAQTIQSSLGALESMLTATPQTQAMEKLAPTATEALAADRTAASEGR